MNAISKVSALARISSAAVAGFLLAIPGAAIAEKYPSKPVQLISPLPVGGSTDVATRAWMECASQEKLAGQPFVLLNRPGANGVIAANVMKQQPSDGYSLFIAGMSQMSITPFIFKKQPYDSQKDFTGAAIFGTTPFMLVASPQSGIRSVKELQSFAKASASGIDLGIPAIAAPAHLMSAALADKLEIKATLVPQSGEANAITALMGGQIPAMIFVAGSVAQFVESGKLVPLMVFTKQRLPQFPNTPTVVEVLGDETFVRYGWLGIAAKAGSPPEVVSAVEGWTKSCLDTPAFQQALRNALFTPRFIDAAEYRRVVQDDIAFWKTWISKLAISND